MKSRHGTELFLITEKKILMGHFFISDFWNLLHGLNCDAPTKKNPIACDMLSDMSQVRLGQVMGGKELK